MGLILTLVYISLAFLSPAETLPWLAPYRILLWLAVLAGLASVPSLLQRPGAVLNPTVVLFAGFVGSLALSRAANGWFGGAVYAVQDFLPVTICFFLVLINIDSLGKLRALVFCVVAIGLLHAGLGAYAYVQHDPNNPRVMVQLLEAEGQAGQIYELYRMRAVGFLNDPNDFAQYLLVVLPLMLFFWRGRMLMLRSALLVAAGLFLLVSVYLTASRGAILGLAVLAAVPLRKRLGKTAAPMMTAGLVVAMLGAKFGGGRSVSISGGIDRLNIWSDGLGMFKHSPLWGIGYGAFDSGGHTAHNSFLLCASETGLIGLFFWTGLVVLSVMQLRNMVVRARLNPALAEEARLGTLVQVSLYTFLVTSFFLSRTYVLTLYVLAGMATVLSQLVPQAAGSGEATAESGAPALSMAKWLGWTIAVSAGSIFLIYAGVRLRAF